MAFSPNNSFNNNTTNSGEKKTNFRIGKIWGSDGQLEVSLWIANTGVRAILRIKSAVGKDPSTGATVLEQRKPNELPGFFMNIDVLKAFIDYIATITDYGSMSFSIDKGSNNKLTVIGQGNTIKMTIDSQKLGSKTITFDSIAVGNKNIHAAFMNLIEYLKICYKKALTNKLDPDEFGMAIGSSSSDDNDDLSI